MHINEAKAAVAVAAGKLQLSFGEPKVELADLMLLSRQMHTLLKSGVPIIRALSGLEQSAANPTLRSTVVEVREGLESGRELSQALRQHPKVFPPYMVSLVRVGEVTGVQAAGWREECTRSAYRIFRDPAIRLRSCLKSPVPVSSRASSVPMNSSPR